MRIFRIMTGHSNQNTIWYFAITQSFSQTQVPKFEFSLKTWQFPLQHFMFSGAAEEVEHCCPAEAQHDTLGSWQVPFTSLPILPMIFFSPQQVSCPQQCESELHPKTFSCKQSRHSRSKQKLFSVAGQWESIQHSRHLLNGHTPQQWPDAQSESGIHDLPLGLGVMHTRFL